MNVLLYRIWLCMCVFVRLNANVAIRNGEKTSSNNNNSNSNEKCQFLTGKFKRRRKKQLLDVIHFSLSI